MRVKNVGEKTQPMGREGKWREMERTVNPFPTVRHICGLTQTGKQAALQSKPQTIPQRNSGPPHGWEWEWTRQRRERPQLTVWCRRKVGCTAYLFARPLPLLENKHVLVIWQHSGMTGQALKPLLSLCVFTNICSESVRLHNIYKQFSFLPFLWLMGLSKAMLQSLRCLKHT